jgi:hypothetical protein
LYENEDLDEFIRMTGLKAMAILANNGLLPEQELSTYIGDALQRLPREPSYAWDELVAVASDFCFKEHRAAVLKLYDDGIADPDVDRKEDVLERFDSGQRESHLMPYRLVDDVLQETMWWSASRDHESSESSPDEEKALSLSAIDRPSNPRGIENDRKPFVHASKKISRNDPCPCGSGKKFKKCCSQ